jgi:hypothetical protein
MKTVQEVIENNIEWLNKKIQKQKELQPIFEKALHLAKTSEMFRKFFIIDFTDCKVVLEFDVSSFSQIEPLLVQMENALSIEFTKTIDCYDTGCRLIYSKCGIIRIDLRPREDSALCRQEIVGYEPKPVYKFICKGE